MSRKSALIVMSVLFALFVGILVINKPKPVLAQTAKLKPVLGKTFLEGMALDEEGEPLYKNNVIRNGNQTFNIKIVDKEGNTVMSLDRFPVDMGGLYRVELKPGVYDIFIQNGFPWEVKLKPLRINGVLVKGGKINKLDITLHKGEGLETIGEPVETTLPAIIVSETFEKMQKQSDDLKARVEKLEKK